MYQSLIKAIESYIIKADESLADILKREGYIKSKKTLEYIQQVESETAEVLIEQRDFILEEIEKSVDLETFLNEIWGNVKINDVLKFKIATIFAENLNEFVPEFVNYYIQQTDRQLQLKQVSKKTLSWIDSWSKELGEIMQLNSHMEIETILKRGLEKGSGIPVITQEIIQSGIRNEYYKARRVAVTEVLTAHRAAQQEAFMQSPVVKEKMWKHTGSYRNQPRQNHIHMDGQRVLKQEPYTLIGADGTTYYPMYPGDTCLPAKERINCHCLSQSVADENILGLTLEERKELQRKAVQEMDDKWEKEANKREKAKAGIDENTVKCDWLKNKTVEERKKYFECDSRWALFESGVIQNDIDLEKLYKTVTTEKGIKKEFKTLTELNQDGIITVSNERWEHSTLGNFSNLKNPKKPPGGANGGKKLKGGGHSQTNIDELSHRNINYKIEKIHENGVRIGGVEGHEENIKKLGNIGQAWFPKNWSDDEVLKAGTYTVNKPAKRKIITNDSGINTGYEFFQKYNGVTVGVFTDLQYNVGTIFPDGAQRSIEKEEEWNGYQ